MLRLKSASDVDSLAREAVLGGSDSAKEKARQAIREQALAEGVYPASIQGLYEAAGRGLYSGVTVPAINIRGITYDVARAVFAAALENQTGAVIFEIARSEIGYTGQRPAEYAACILAAALKEGFRGPVFIQGDHFQVNASKYAQDSGKELDTIRGLIREALDAGFYNIDIDASTIVDLSKPTLAEQQEDNCRVTAEMTSYIRSIEPDGVAVSIGGEIGEVGKENSTVEDLRAFMSGYRERLDSGLKGISKISVQTGTSHGGVVLPDGSVARVKIDFETLRELSRVAREDYGMGGAVQHGASTLPDDAFDKFPEVGTVEVHLATGFQNIIYDSPYFPKKLLERVNQHLMKEYTGERKADETDEQFLYKTRKKAFGDFKKEMWGMPTKNLSGLRFTLEDRFSLIFRKLNVTDTVDLVGRYVSPPQ